MTSKHTPAPWFVDGMDIKSFSDPAHIRLAEVHAGRPREEHEANARLIAAAPELLEALKEATLHIWLGNEAGVKANIKAHAIIAKATGEPA